MIYQMKTYGKTDPKELLLDPQNRDRLLDALNNGGNGVSDLHDYLNELQDVVTKFEVTEVFSDGSLCWDVHVERTLNKKEKAYLIDYLWGQCSDGWGEGFEQYPFMIVKNQEYFYSPWNGNRTQKPEFE